MFIVLTNKHALPRKIIVLGNLSQSLSNNGFDPVVSNAFSFSQFSPSQMAISGLVFFQKRTSLFFWIWQSGYNTKIISS